MKKIRASKFPFTYNILQLRFKFSNYIYLLLIIIAGFYFRTFNINWDSGYYFHPDERAIVMLTTPLGFPKSFGDFLSINSPLNPHFFAYGNFPIYLLKFISEFASYVNPLYKEYSQMYVVGRLISASFDTLTIFIVFLLSSYLFSKRTGLISSLLYAFFVFPIQSSHFYTVDPILTFFMTITIFQLASLVNNRSLFSFILLGLFFGLALATKITAAILAPLIIGFLLIFMLKNIQKGRKIMPLIFKTGVFVLVTVIIFFATQPYALIDIQEYIQQTIAQSEMSKNPFIFPYTLQYVGKIPFGHEFINIFLWGIGPLMGFFCFLGLFWFVFERFTKKSKWRLQESIIIVYFTSYFLLFGSFAVGWMRYMLPIYPILAIFGGWLISKKILHYIKPVNYITKKAILFFFLIMILIYPLSFITIYTKPNTRIQASVWINKNIPYGSTLAVEHWDDALPIYGQQNYQQITLPLYEQDTPAKWQSINKNLKNVDYIIIASTRLYVPLQKLTDCKKIPAFRCYPLTAQYYKKLFSGKMGFFKVAEFAEYPTIPIVNLRIDDFSSDESFTVNDHPKIMIFKKL